METEKQIATEVVKKIATWKIIAMVSAGIIITIGAWIGLTKANIIPNFLDIEALSDPKMDPCRYQPNDPDSSLIHDCAVAGKPVIYLYPTKKTDVKVELDYQGELIADYPDYNKNINGWEVSAYPDGKIINKEDNLEYSYLFWEGVINEPIDWDLSQGFVVKGEDTKEFLQNMLSEMGLTPKEYNEFIVYWYPKMKDNPYNLIHFAGEKYVETAPLKITPEPDSMLRVFMVFKALDKPIEIKEQKIQPFTREGFAVIEWGGTEIK